MKLEKLLKINPCKTDYTFLKNTTLFSCKLELRTGSFLRNKEHCNAILKLRCQYFPIRQQKKSGIYIVAESECRSNFRW